MWWKQLYAFLVCGVFSGDVWVVLQHRWFVGRLIFQLRFNSSFFQRNSEFDFCKVVFDCCKDFFEKPSTLFHHSTAYFGNNLCWLELSNREAREQSLTAFDESCFPSSLRSILSLCDKTYHAFVFLLFQVWTLNKFFESIVENLTLNPSNWFSNNLSDYCCIFLSCQPSF